MSKAASEREAQSRRIIKAMNAKGLSFKSLSAEIGVSPFTTAAALHGRYQKTQRVGQQRCLAWRERRSF